MGLHNQSAFKRVLMLTAGSTATPAEALLNAYGPNGFAMTFSGSEPSIKIVDNTTPSNNWDSKEGPANSVQNFFKTRSFTSYTGPVTSGKRLMQADGYIKPCRHNLLPMSNRFGSAAWTRTAVTSTYGQTDVDGGATASLITESNTSTSVLYNATAFTTAANVPYTISCKIKKGNSTWVRLAFGTSGGTFTNGVQQWYNLDTVATGTAATTGTASYISSSITATTNSYYILTLTASQASTTGAFIVSTATADASATRTTSGTYYICHAMANAGQQALDYVSSEAHNLVIQSRTLGTSWTATDITVGNNATTSPDGTTSAESLTEGVAGTALLRSTAFTVPASSTVTASFYFKTSTATWVRFTLADGSDTNGVRQWFNLSTGAKGTLTAIGSGTATSSAITACANGWYLCEITGVCSTSTSLTMSVSSASADASNTRVNSVVYYADCAQAELATSAGKVTTTTTTSVFNPHFDIPVEYNTDGTVKALTREEARTNLALYSNDLTNAAWTKSNMSTAMTATGVDGASSSATTCTATAANATVLQAITSASSARITSAYIKRRTGSGNIDMTQDNGSTWTTVSVTSSWTRLNIASVTSTNPTVGLRIVTSGDEIDVMYFQHEAAATISSPIATGSAAVTRAADVITWPTTIFPYNQPEGTIYVAWTPTGQDSYRLAQLSNGATRVSDMNVFTSGTSFTSYNGTTQFSTQTTNSASKNKAATVYKTADYALSVNGAAVATLTTAAVQTATAVYLGHNHAPSSYLQGGIHEFSYFPTRVANADLVTLSTL